MAIRNRRGVEADLDRNKLLAGEFAITTSGKLIFCYDAGQTKEVATTDDLRSILNSSASAYAALQQLISDLGSETVLTSLLNTQLDVNNAKRGEDTLTDKVIKFDSELAAKVNQVDFNLQKARTDEITATVNNYYVKCLSTDPGALLVVSSGATTGQINIAEVKHISDYTPIVGDYVTQATNTLLAGLDDIKIGAKGETYLTPAEAVRGQISDLKKDLINISNFNIWNLGDVTCNYTSGATYVSKYYDIPLIKGKEYTISIGAISGSSNDSRIKIYNYQSDSDVLYSLLGTKLTFTSPVNGIRIYFFATYNQAPSISGTAIWSDIKLVESRYSNNEDILSIKKAFDISLNIWNLGDVTCNYTSGATYVSKYYDIPLIKGKEHVLQVNSVVGTNDGYIQVYPYGADKNPLTSLFMPSTKFTFTSPVNGIRIYFFATYNQAPSISGTAIWSDIKLVEGTEIYENAKIKSECLPTEYFNINTALNIWNLGDVTCNYTSGATYVSKYYDIPLIKGKEHVLQVNSVVGTNDGYIQVYPYGTDKNPLTSLFMPSTKFTFTSPVNGIRIYFFATYNQAPSISGTAIWSDIKLVEGTEIYENIKINKLKVNNDSLPNYIHKNFKLPNTYTVKKSMFTDGEALSISTSNTKQNNIIGFTCTVSYIGTVTIYCENAITGYGDSKIEITSDNILIYKNSGTYVLDRTILHGLTISDYLSVMIRVNNNKTAVLRISTSSGQYSSNINWLCGKNYVGVRNNQSLFMNCLLTFYVEDYRKKVWAFGDSYFETWPWIANNYGCNNFMIDGYSGRTSISAIKSLKLCLDNGVPAIILWCMGMNDADSTNEINSSWLAAITELKIICSENNIILIPCTIPNVPSRSHVHKNTYIKNNFNRYVDVNNAVGAENNIDWYTGLLSLDKIHPTEMGANVISSKIMAEVPEII